MTDLKTKYVGNDNYRKPKSNYLDSIAAMDETALFNECKSKIWLAAYAANNPRSDYHWQCDACYDECRRREKPDIYSNAYTVTYESEFGRSV